MTVTYL